MQRRAKVVVGLVTLLLFLHSQAQGAMQVIKAEIKSNGFIDLRVRGAKALTPVVWQENRVGTTRKDGRVELLTPLVPRNCVGVLQIGTETVEVRMKNCRASSRFTPVLATGQTTSHTVGDDGDVEKGVKRLKLRFRNNLDGTITDLHTGIVWLKQVNCQAPGTWQQDHDFAQQLQHGMCGLRDGSKPGDWVVPNVSELQSLLDYGASGMALSPEHGFVGVETNSLHWTSTTHAADATKAYLIDFATAEVRLVDKHAPIAAGWWKKVKKAASSVAKSIASAVSASETAIEDLFTDPKKTALSTVGVLVGTVVGSIIIYAVVKAKTGATLPDSDLSDLGIEAVEAEVGLKDEADFVKALQDAIEKQTGTTVDEGEFNEAVDDIEDSIDDLFAAVEDLEGEGGAVTEDTLDTEALEILETLAL